MLIKQNVTPNLEKLYILNTLPLGEFGGLAVSKKEEPKTYGLAIATLIMGIMTVTGFVGSLLEVLFIILTLVFGIISLVEIKKRKNLTGKGYVWVGFAFMIIFVILSSVSFYTAENCNKSFIQDTYTDDCDAICQITCFSEGYTGDHTGEMIYQSPSEYGQNTCKCVCMGCPTR